MSNSPAASSTRLHCGPAMPRTETPKPSALPSVAISAAIFVPSAKDVIIFGRWKTASANAFCVSGVR